MLQIQKNRYAATLAKVLLVATTTAMISGSAMASNLGYHPVSPTFGGNPSSAEWAKFNAHTQKRDSNGGNGSNFTIPDFSGLFNSLNELEGDLSDTTIIIPVF